MQVRQNVLYRSMLSRRQLRVKVLQALYAYFQADKSDLAVAGRELFRSIEKVHELYIYLLSLLRELADSDQADADDLHLKFFPKAEEVNAKHRLFNIRFIQAMVASRDFELFTRRYHTSWQKDLDLVRKLFLEIKKSEEYRNFLLDDQANERDFLLLIMTRFLEPNETLEHHVEEENIFWQEDFSFVCHIINRTIRTFYDAGRLELMPVYKDEADDKDFVRQLFEQTILNNREYEAAVSKRTQNWDVERIAMMDILLLKMALAELVHFSGIPVKVSINEYIEISKDFSTPKSKQFINGIIDKLAADYKADGKIVKTGRGLLE